MSIEENKQSQNPENISESNPNFFTKLFQFKDISEPTYKFKTTIFRKKKQPVKEKTLRQRESFNKEYQRDILTKSTKILPKLSLNNLKKTKTKLAQKENTEPINKNNTKSTRDLLSTARNTLFIKKNSQNLKSMLDLYSRTGLFVNNKK